MTRRFGRVENLWLFVMHFLIPRYSLHREDRLGNADLPFPIGFVFGDRDFLSSDGPDELIKKNKFFETGES